MFEDAIPDVTGSMTSALWIALVLVVVLVLIFALPFIFRKLFSRKNICTCGQKLKPTDEYCPRCGKKVEK